MSGQITVYMRKDSTGSPAILCLILLILLSGCINQASEPGNIRIIPNQTDSLPPLEIFTEEQPPFNYIDEQGQVSGRSTEIVQEIMRRNGVNYPVYLRQWTDGYRTVQIKPNTAIFSTIKTHERDRQFRWVGPIAELQFSFYTRSDNPVEIRNVLDLRHQGMIAVVRNDAREQYLKALNMSNILSLDDDAACIRALSSGKAEFWLGTKDYSSQHAKRQDESMSEFRILDLPVISHRLYIAFHRKTPDQVIDRWQQTLDEMNRDGTYDRIQSRYMPYICSWVECTP